MSLDCTLSYTNLARPLTSTPGAHRLTPSGNIGKDASIFEAVHGSAPDIAGQGYVVTSSLLTVATRV